MRATGQPGTSLAQVAGVMTGPGVPTGRQTVLVVDDDVRMRDMVIYALREQRVTIRYASTRDAAMEAARLNPPAVVVTAYEIDGAPSGPSIARACRRQYDSAVVFIAGQVSDRHFDAVAALDDSALLCRPVRVEQLQVTLRVMLQRKMLARERSQAPDRRSSPLSRALRQIAAIVTSTGLLEVRTDNRPSETVLALLRPREQEIVRLLFDHMRVPAIARQLGISPQTVRNHLKRIYQRLGVHSQQELMARLQPSRPRGAAAAVEDDVLVESMAAWEPAQGDTSAVSVRGTELTN